MWDPPRLAVGVHQVQAADAEAGARRAGGIVDAAVDHVTAVAGLVGGWGTPGEVRLTGRTYQGASDVPTDASLSSTANRRRGRRRSSSRAAARPTMPAPTTATSTCAAMLVFIGGACSRSDDAAGAMAFQFPPMHEFAPMYTYVGLPLGRRDWEVAGCG
jgi:hypothetical protein